MMMERLNVWRRKTVSGGKMIKKTRGDDGKEEQDNYNNVKGLKDVRDK